MGRQTSSKCLTCSYLITEEARRLHGFDGDQCWDDLEAVCKEAWKNLETLAEQAFQVFSSIVLKTPESFA